MRGGDGSSQASAMESTTASAPAAAVDGGRAEALFAALYAELHRLARAQLRGNSGASLSATTLLHEAYLSLREREAAAFPDRERFIAYAARAMRGLVVDYVRNRRAQKRGGEFHLTAFDTKIAEGIADEDVPQIGDALAALAQVEPQLAELVDLKFFCGMTIAEIAALRGVSERTVRRDWLKARVYLRRDLAGGKR
jgi:RNA polymerase sigma factor (TIGR02999 family)